MVEDIANGTRDSDRFPYLRNFDAYESHSWADGFAVFADGNNQESTSEAVNAWYSIYLWGKTTGNSALSGRGLYLYNSEILGTKYYWFDIKGIYPPPYKHKIASIVWGGKVDFATWFSCEANMIYGIQLLPFTPASTYLGMITNFDQYEADYLASGGKPTGSWGELFAMWKSFYHPDAVFSQKDQFTQLESNNSKSLFLYILYKNKFPEL